MAVVTGALIFDADRRGEIDFANDSGVANIPMIAVNINFLMYLLEIIESL